MLSNYGAGHVCGDQMDIINGRPTGSVRVSFGYMSTFEDAWMFLNFVKECFLVSTNIVSTESYDQDLVEDDNKNNLELQGTNCQVNTNGTDLEVEENRVTGPNNEEQSEMTINELTAKLDRFDLRVEASDHSLKVEENSIGEINDVFKNGYDCCSSDSHEINLRRKESQEGKEIEANYSSDEEYFDCTSGAQDHRPVTNNLQTDTNISDETIANGSCFVHSVDEKTIFEDNYDKKNDNDNYANSKIDSLDQESNKSYFEQADQRPSTANREGKSEENRNYINFSVSRSNNQVPEGDTTGYSKCYLKQICLYPVKSCAAFNVNTKYRLFSNIIVITQSVVCKLFVLTTFFFYIYIIH